MCPYFIWLVSTELLESNQSVHCFQTLTEKKDQVAQLSFMSPRVKESFLEGFFLCSELNEPHDVHSFRHVQVFVVVLKVLIYIMLCCRFVYETEHFNGVGELLEILGR